MSRYDFKAMRDNLKRGAVQVVAAPQLFPTPPDIAARMAAELDGWQGEAWDTLRILEPSAGTGNLITAALDEWPDAHVTAWEVNAQLAEGLRRRYASPVVTVHTGDFLQVPLPKAPAEQFDAVLMNPPFERGIWQQHLTRAFNMLRPGGRLVAVLPDSPRVPEALKSLSACSGVQRLPDNSFAGTGVRTVLVTLDNEE